MTQTVVQYRRGDDREDAWFDLRIDAQSVEEAEYQIKENIDAWNHAPRMGGMWDTARPKSYRIVEREITEKVYGYVTDEKGYL
jgi:hypothetical protein